MESAWMEARFAVLQLDLGLLRSILPPEYVRMWNCACPGSVGLTFSVSGLFLGDFLSQGLSARPRPIFLDRQLVHPHVKLLSSILPDGRLLLPLHSVSGLIFCCRVGPPGRAEFLSNIPGSTAGVSSCTATIINLA